MYINIQYSFVRSGISGSLYQQPNWNKVSDFFVHYPQFLELTVSDEYSDW